MDVGEGFALGAFVTSMTAIIGYLVKLNHHRIRSKCCDKDCTTSVDVEATTPPELKISIPKPE
jgi:hypothetical protein